MRKLIILFGILIAGIGPAGAATYYVDNVNGRDEPAWNGGPLEPWKLAVIPVFLFLAVWLPCCTSDIVFPLLFVRASRTCESPAE